jgi:hypothetical protein
LLPKTNGNEAASLEAPDSSCIETGENIDPGGMTGGAAAEDGIMNACGIGRGLLTL